MRFEFCGKLDCPDWILAQLFHASKLDLERFSTICHSVKDTILADGALDEIALLDRLKSIRDDSFDLDDMRACFGALNYIITNACIYKVTCEQLNLELEQLGLPEELCMIVTKLIKDNLDDITNCL